VEILKSVVVKDLHSVHKLLLVDFIVD
jgi:hypothetical protein